MLANGHLVESLSGSMAQTSRSLIANSGLGLRPGLSLSSVSTRVRSSPTSCWSFFMGSFVWATVILSSLRGAVMITGTGSEEPSLGLRFLHLEVDIEDVRERGQQ